MKEYGAVFNPYGLEDPLKSVQGSVYTKGKGNKGTYKSSVLNSGRRIDDEKKERPK